MLLRIFLAPTSFLAAIIWTIWAEAAEPIMVLAPFNLTGPQAVLGAPCYKGAELAVEKLNAAGGVLSRPIELIPIDTASPRTRAVSECHCRHRSHGFHLCSRRGAGISKGRNPLHHAGRYSAGPATSGRTVAVIKIDDGVKTLVWTWIPQSQ